MRVIIAGSRTIADYAAVKRAAEHAQAMGLDITEVVSGGAPGVDRLGERWAANVGIPVRRFPADWSTFGKSAGPIRNEQMAAYADALIVVHDGQSKGTRDMVSRAGSYAMPIFYYDRDARLVEEKSHMHDLRSARAFSKIFNERFPGRDFIDFFLHDRDTYRELCKEVSIDTSA